MGLNAKSIGRKILQARLAKGMTQAQLAKALNVDRGTVGRWETGHAVPRQISVPKVAAALGQAPEALLAGSEHLDSSDITNAQNESVLRAEKATLKEIRAQVSLIAEATQAVHKAPAVPEDQDRMLADIIAGWDSAKPAARLVAAYLITEDWTYRLKLWNQEISVDEAVLKTLKKAR